MVGRAGRPAPAARGASAHGAAMTKSIARRTVWTDVFRMGPNATSNGGSRQDGAPGHRGRTAGPGQGKTLRRLFVEDLPVGGPAQGLEPEGGRPGHEPLADALGEEPPRVTEALVLAPGGAFLALDDQVAVRDPLRAIGPRGQGTFPPDGLPCLVGQPDPVVD